MELSFVRTFGEHRFLEILNELILSRVQMHMIKDKLMTYPTMKLSDFYDI